MTTGISGDSEGSDTTDSDTKSILIEFSLLCDFGTTSGVSKSKR